ncbi:CPBP family intramembrane glutamic endopeptidase [Nocardia sp. NPDC050710]|uniref:CPBP family intramembrane glutamic endopeptidase n=1 Tax=Nocardia sp. NPDC050710 TaxID=3157220 RepID=UPI003403BC3E
MIARRNDFALFFTVSFISAWVLACGPWLDGKGLSSLWLRPGAAMMMFTPALGVLAVWNYRRRTWRELAVETGAMLGPRPHCTLWLTAAAWLGTPLFLWIAFGLSAVFGLYRFSFDFVSSDVAAVVVVEALTLSTIGTLPFALGEEVGWRGWLLPHLAGRLGPGAAVAASGVIWGLWHAPLTLLGYNYPNLGAWAAPAFLGFCLPFGAILGWLRLHTGSIWPCVVAHAAFNASTGVFSSFESLDRRANPLLAGFGLVGWAVLVLLAVALYMRHPIRARPPVPQAVPLGRPQPSLR